MARRNPNSPVFKETIVLTEEQEQAIVDLKAEREIFKEQLKRAKRKRNKIKDILDNFEAVVIGDVLLDVLPDENADEIVNSVIISKTDIINVLDGFDTTLAEDPTSYEDTPSGYSEGTVDSAKDTLDRIFNSSTIRELISLSPILNDGELYSPIYFQRINEVSGGPNGKELLEEIIKDIETTSKEPNVFPIKWP